MHRISTKDTSELSRFWASNRDWPEDREVRNLLPFGLTNWPSLVSDFSNPIPAVALNSLRSLGPLKKEKLWLVKDGALPLISFFQRFQHPPETDMNLLIHVKWMRLVPNRWKKNCMAYHVASSRNLTLPFPDIAETARTKLLVTGFFHEDYCCVDFFESTLSQARKKTAFRELFRSGTIVFLTDQMALHSDGKYLINLTSILRKYFKGNIEFRSLGQLKFAGDLSDGIIIDINERLICSDDSPTHTLLSRGAILPKIYKIPKGAKTVSLSPFHSLFFYPCADAATSFLDSVDFLEIKHLLEVSQDSKKHGGLTFGFIPDWIKKLDSFKDRFLRG